MRDAVRVADLGTSELKDAVRQGKVSAKAAADVADLPADEQKEALAEGAKALAKAARKAKAAKSPKAAQLPLADAKAPKLGSGEAARGRRSATAVGRTWRRLPDRRRPAGREAQSSGPRIVTGNASSRSQSALMLQFCDARRESMATAGENGHEATTLA
jgi:hypothetical protein